MKRLCIITFDIVREGEPQTAYSVGNLISYLKSKPEFDTRYRVDHFSFNLWQIPNRKFDWDFEANSIPFESYDFFAISGYIWAHDQAVALMRWIKDKKLIGKVVVGGYQVNVNKTDYLKGLYPDADHYILGYAEEALYQLLIGQVQQTIINNPVNFSSLSSPYLDNTIVLPNGVRKVRLETKRGCPYQCTFCAQHDLNQTKPEYHLERKLIDELDYLSKINLSRISVTDPVFNMGSNYLTYLTALKELKMNGVFNFQVRPELIAREKDVKFIELLAETNSEIELGIQTFDPTVNKLIKRGNQYSKIDESLEMLRANHIQFGISLIYGLPGQTLSSFESDIDKLQKLGIQEVVAFPLMILPGTEMFNRREEFGLKEGKIDSEYGIPHVVASNTFSEREWLSMHELALGLNVGPRLF